MESGAETRFRLRSTEHLQFRGGVKVGQNGYQDHGLLPLQITDHVDSVSLHPRFIEHNLLSAMVQELVL